MSKQYQFILPDRYDLPTRAGDILFLGQLTGSADALECAHISEKHSGPVILITSDIQSALRLSNEIQQFTMQIVTTLSDWETLPYDSFSPHKDIISARLLSLYQLPTMKRGVFIMPVKSLMQRVCPHEFLHRHSLIMQKGQKLSGDRLRIKLQKAGYRSVDQVVEHGEFATRGSLLDLYPMGSDNPYRINFLNGKIDSLRIFDIDSQRTLNEVEYFSLLPAHEFPITETAIELFRSQWRENLEVRRDPEHIYQQVSKGIWPAGIEYWQPLFFRNSLPPLFSYFPSSTLLINTADLKSAADRFWLDLNQRYKNRCVDPMRPLLRPNKLWLCVDELFFLIKKWPCIQLKSEKLKQKNYHINLKYHSLPELKVQKQNKNMLHALHVFTEISKDTIIFSVESEGRRETLIELLAIIKIKPDFITHLQDAEEGKIYIMQGACERGFINPVLKLVLICENDLIGERFSRSQENKSNTNTSISNFSDLIIDYPVVHVEHGVGRYSGMVTLTIGGIKGEYLILKYADDAKLYVPISSLFLLTRYSGVAIENAPLHKLGSDSWARARKKASEKVRDVAAELLDIHAIRATKTGFAFKKDCKSYQMFCEGFRFEPTTDQKMAINSVLHDMCQPLAMDRLICGDVGFGKTEVAMRAAFLAVDNNKQVAVLVPTTLLAQQHYDNFRDRFANWPVRIEMISRFRSVKEQKQIIRDTIDGKVDILIGTHKLLQADMQWSNLALLIVDEEHRFGVRQKERIKAICASVDILTLTATPIPRTLNMAMIGMRELSIISTPPARRLAVKTFVREYDTLLVREAILREITRGGQVYYLYNNVENIEKAAHRLSELVPEAFLKIGHGQMRERDLERVINDFYHQRFNLLVCTTIIDTGIDLPNANTIIIERADHFGLAQLYQLRGRVGRSFHQAYAYLLMPEPQSISADARKRLEAISSLDRLGSGFMLATQDLEIRGAGELLGDDQSGQISTIGFSLYMELLESAIDALKEGREPSLEDLVSKQTLIKIRLPSLLPDSYIADVGTRLSFYKRIASLSNIDELEDLKVELIDRFGLLPDTARNLIKSTKFRLDAMALGICRIECHEQGGFFEFKEKNQVNLIFLVELLNKEPHLFRLDGPNKLNFIVDLSDSEVRLEFIAYLLALLTKNKVT
ncbi:transcription-repair coupling factor [Candidatus Profftia tarda]|uniref:Transcription-repair-coupling factor n=1 Tax=Candidatus Profftia tarda TaxID=1177216 RepID=A0A8E4EYJ2_9ENTR|nr:transcription-repair coupling factor [Candidatus Profftia tarda]CAD6508703.1 Transcription-repair-coupling factor [Candidatus Profftia tarda]